MSKFKRWEYGPATGAIYFPGGSDKGTKKARQHIYHIMRRKRGWC